MALLMVLSSITILIFILAEFTASTRLNTFKVYNQRDQGQARLNAEAGIRYGMTQLKIYKEATNALLKNKSLPLSATDLESVIKIPFVLPMPLDTKNMTLVQQKAVQTFTENILLPGKLLVSIVPVNAFLNPNNLIITSSKENSNKNSNDTSEDTPLHQLTKQEFIKMITQALDREKEDNPNYEILYEDLEAESLVEELIYYINPAENYQSNVGDFQRLYEVNNIRPKHAPLTSLDELYLLQGWNDAVVDLVKDRLSVHPVDTIHLNEITDKQLEFIFPIITEDQKKEFFQIRDGDPSNNILPTPLSSLSAFQSLIVDRLNVVSEEEYQERINELEKANIQFDTGNKVFKITSFAEVGRSKYTIEAYVHIPALFPPPPSSPEENDNPPPQNPQRNSNNGQITNRNNEKKDEKEEIVLLDPRIVEIKIL